MAVVANKRSVMTLYSSGVDIFSHRVRIVLAEKGVSVEVLNLEPGEKSEDLFALNPYGTTPTLVDRDLVLYDVDIIMEYLDERFPHPPLMPVYPVARARTRMMIHRIDREWGTLIRVIENGKPTEAQAAAKELKNHLVSVAPLFNTAGFFLNEEFSIADCCIAPILWRLPAWGIKLPTEAKSIERYAERIFMRDSFQASLTEAEQELRQMQSAEIA
ncbi:MAG: glutathione S-transferase N-terminal domain-containing protein [Gammaproteobacteria bacterium]|nr:glutathione S-transferase N-terminal domain-containing protein [Gammaproteobacteria bacterium]